MQVGIKEKSKTCSARPALGSYHVSTTGYTNYYELQYIFFFSTNKPQENKHWSRETKSQRRCLYQVGASLRNFSTALKEAYNTSVFTVMFLVKIAPHDSLRRYHEKAMIILIARKNYLHVFSENKQLFDSSYALFRHITISLCALFVCPAHGKIENFQNAIHHKS